MDFDRQPTQADWERFVIAVPHSPLLQSWAWGEFQSAAGRSVFRWLIRDDGRVVSALQGFLHRYPLGTQSFYLPHGPVGVIPLSLMIWQSHIQVLESLATKKQVLFVRFEPTVPMPDGLISARRVPSIQPPATLLLDLQQSEAALFAGMHQKTRYNIRLAEKHGVTVDVGGQELLADFETVLRQTEHRQGVHFFRPAYFRTLWSVPALGSAAKIFRARLNNETLAAILVIRYGDTVTYLHGGSSDRGREHMAPHLLQWAAIRQAKAESATWYDFRGVAPRDAGPDHPWAGFSRFKRGFGGVDVEYPGTYDWVRRPFVYSLYRLAQRLHL